MALAILPLSVRDMLLGGFDVGHRIYASPTQVPHGTYTKGHLHMGIKAGTIIETVIGLVLYNK
jgi:hypothetical protein